MRGPSFFEPEVREGFYISDMMKRFWASQMAVLARIDAICEREGIRWFADYGTLLGAVRHGGFIPWDDDMDVSMLRPDFEKFLAAADSLPEGYKVMRFEDTRDILMCGAKVISGSQISTEASYLQRQAGCPYTVGVDIFVLDGVSEDPAYEEQRFEKLKALGKQVQTCHADHIPYYKQMEEELRRQIPVEKAERVTSFPNYMRNGRRCFDKNIFQHRIRLPFEDAFIYAPAGYDRLLKDEYGDYMALHRGGSMHGYPAYRGQEEILVNQFGHNPLAYAIHTEDLAPPAREKTVAEHACEVFTMAEKIITNLPGVLDIGSFDTALTLLVKCQELLISLGERLEKKDGAQPMIRELEIFCEKLFLCYENLTAQSIYSLQGALDACRMGILTRLKNRKKEVLFLYCRHDWWEDTARSVWEKLAGAQEFEFYRMRCPCFRREDDGTAAGEFEQDGLYLGIDGLLTPEEYDIAARHPDMILFQYPFDQWSRANVIPEQMWSRNLRRYTEKLIYLPGVHPDIPCCGDQTAVTALQNFLQQPATVFSDQIWVKSMEHQQLYRQLLTQICGDPLREYWEQKIRLTDEALTELITGGEMNGKAG
ncbi:MAG: LicD family protein [Lachnospiraceae bacterium]|nr:LicD family protein [Lachnospiraceae bacterium]